VQQTPTQLPTIYQILLANPRDMERCSGFAGSVSKQKSRRSTVPYVTVLPSLLAGLLEPAANSMPQRTLGECADYGTLLARN
jgi:hypothetical protein